MGSGVKQVRIKITGPDDLSTAIVPGVDRLEAMILSNLRNSEGESIAQLLDSLAEQGLEDQATIRAKISQLLADGKIELTRLRRLRIRSVTRTQYSTKDQPDEQHQISKAKAAVAGTGA